MCSVRFAGLSFREGKFLPLIESFNCAEQVPKSIHFVALSTLSALKRDRELLDFMSDNISICDSRVLEFISVFGNSRLDRCRGTDFLRLALKNGAFGTKQLFLGGSHELLDLISIKVDSISNRAIQSFYLNPGLVIEELPETVVEQITEIDPRIIWVGLGSPKQDKIARQLLHEFDAWVICVGAAFDFFAESKKEAPPFFVIFGLEWLFRLITEPKRLFPRYRRDFITAILLSFQVIHDRFRKH
jgi:N-acetylglucosaminyldiphosphoundecaprenol N-acetyl-beta-D-mannosaminyltransferase